MTSVECDDDEEGLCYLQIKSIDEVNNITVWNSYLRPPAYQNSTFYYRSGMLQTWNKFCFQGDDNGYLRWMIGSHPIFEIPAEAVVDTPQGGSKPNPQLTFPEEPSYIILNVALSAAWVFLTIVVFIVMDIRRRRKLVKDAEKANIYVEADMKSAKAMSSSSETTTFASTENDGDDTRMSPLTSGPYHRFR
ncbi:hypothetical protein PF011_g2871 [Phytophthora fragariae]|uniref:Uncharacterized protein n=1 Tax=Phytophthora fragariae TaxID=53985 RepID=A0A6A3M2W4_9STRA|nr:hypothetical protein PF011_g2871 [Phytophthora fragariae]